MRLEGDKGGVSRVNTDEEGHKHTPSRDESKGGVRWMREDESMMWEGKKIIIVPTDLYHDDTHHPYQQNGHKYGDCLT
jgi:hypothetical protein